jgi:non-canonical poly(A) RNA polymerase PAPD5/7
MSHSANLPPKPQVGPSSSKDSQETSKKARKRKKNNSTSVTPNNEAEPELSSSTNKNGVETFEENGDFIAFTFSDTDDRPEVPETAVREWDRGKRMHEGSYGKKRKAEEMGRGDRNGGGKRQRSDYVLKAPWVVDVNWEKCNNVPEL